MRRFAPALAWTLGIAAGLAVVAVVGLTRELRASLPILDGHHRLEGLSGPVTVARDALGVPNVRGATREDVARATGFLHAQDRFFQMDLSRRRAAGELAALVGARALVLDRTARIHRFRAEAERAVSLLAPADRRVLDAYVEGVNRGLASLGARPFEYLLLRQPPRPWVAADSMLVVLSMFLTLQDDDGSYETMRATMEDVLPPAMGALLSPRGTEWDSPIDGEAFAMPPVPAADVYNLRARRGGKRRPEPPRLQSTSARLDGPAADDPWAPKTAGEVALGSNNWAVAGSLTPDGGALLANDMHLDIRVPNTWYRMRLEWPAAGGSEPRDLVGVTLPGLPALVVGSNGSVAWGFTNTYADWSDVVLLEVDPADATRYRTPDGWKTFESHEETLEVAGGESERATVLWTIWGPVLPPDYHGRPRAIRWAAHSAERLASSITPIENARTLDEALDAASGIGAPGQNLVVADRAGRIGWGVYGAIPRRIGFDGHVPVSWADGSRGWSGWLERTEYPRVLDPGGGRIWTANARVVGGDMLTVLGDGGYEIGARAHAIRERLMAQERFTPRDMLAIQLDTRAGFLARWRDLVLQTLTPRTVAGREARARFREIVERGWDGNVGPDSVAYRLTRVFREEVSDLVIRFVLSECYEADPTFNYRLERRREGPIWKLVNERPMHLLDPRFPTWDALLLAAVDGAIEETSRSGDLGERRWSEYNVIAYRHPLSAGVPYVGRWLDMPLAALPGDLYTPRVQWGIAGASVRMVVSPGREAEGIMQMPTGQSGHPLSPFYANSHEPWVKGEPTPFLPGPPIHTLTLEP
jgi:penicillin amidase